MDFVWAILIILAVLAFATLITAYICFYKIFKKPKVKVHKEGYIDIPEGEIYEVHRPKITEWVLASRAMPYREVEIKSFDGLRSARTISASWIRYLRQPRA